MKKQMTSIYIMEWDIQLVLILNIKIIVKTSVKSNFAMDLSLQIFAVLIWPSPWLSGLRYSLWFLSFPPTPSFYFPVGFSESLWFSSFPLSSSPYTLSLLDSSLKMKNPHPLGLWTQPGNRCLPTATAQLSRHSRPQTHAQREEQGAGSWAQANSFSFLTTRELSRS